MVTQDTETKVEQTSVKRKHSEIEEEEAKQEPQEQESEAQEPQAKGEPVASSSSSLSDRMAKLKELKRRRVSGMKPLSLYR